MNNSFLPLRVAARWPLLLFVAALASATRASTALERTLNGELAPGIRAVQVDHRSGPVTITGVDQGFGWNWVLSAGRGSREAEEYLKECELEVRETDGTLNLRLVLPEKRSVSHRSTRWFGLFSWSFSGSHGMEIRSTLELRLPRAVAVDLVNRFGTSKVSGLSGSVRLECQNGRVDLSDLSGAVSAKTSFSPLQAARLGAATLRNQNGSLDVSDVTGDLKLETSFARIDVRDVKGRTDLKNRNGSIGALRIDGDLIAATSFSRIEARDIKGRAELTNQNGAIIAHTVGGDLTAASSFGELRVEHVAGKVSLTGRNGSIQASHLGGDVAASTSYAALRILDVRGSAELDCQNGEIAASQVDGNIRAKTSFARMELDGAGKRFDARNQNGSVHITARSPGVERIAATASFAPIDVRLPPDCQPLIRATTSFGKVRSDFPVLLAHTMSDSKFFADSGQVKIDLKGQNGDIRIQQIAAR